MSGTETGKILSAPDPHWTPRQRWAYALGAPYHVQHAAPVDALPRLSETVRSSTLAMCKRDWSVESAEDLIKTLDWLGNEGHRRPHRYRIRQYCLMRRPAIAARREELREAGQEQAAALSELWRVDAVQADWHGIRGGNLLAFDAARAAMLVRCGLVLQWLDGPAAWHYLTNMAADVQRSFTSWAEYAADYKLSRAVWRASAAADPFDAITDQLLADPRSPWRTLPWDIDVPQSRGLDAGPVWSLER